MTSFLKIAVALFVAILLLDNFLPTEKIQTEVHHSTVGGKSSGEIFYIVPLTGGVMESCAVKEEIVRKFPLNSDIFVEKTAILNRCIGVDLPSVPIDSARFVETAIRYSYGDIYSSLDELRADYPGFTPRVRLWGSDFWLFPESFRRYSVELPEELVILDTYGTPRATRSCGSVEGDCELVMPAHPEKGIVGTIQYGAPTYAVAEDFELEWQGDPKAEFFKSGHCFSAYSQFPAAKSLIIRLQGAESKPIQTSFGFFLLVNIGDRYATERISKADFIKSKYCNSKARAAWPNIGWSGWKR